MLSGIDASMSKILGDMMNTTGMMPNEIAAVSMSAIAISILTEAFCDTVAYAYGMQERHHHDGH